MSLPDGVTTCLVTYGPITDTFGNVADSITVEVVADRTIVHAASGRTLFKNPVTVTADAGGVAQIAVPHTNQSGFRDQQQNTLTGWYYTIRLTARFGGNGNNGNGNGVGTSASNIETDVKTFQPVIGQGTVDADLLPSNGMVTPGVTAPAASVTSLAGLVGEVTLAELEDLVGGGGDTVGFATRDGEPVSPAALAPSFPGELWRTDNFLSGYNTTSLTPSLTGNGTQQVLRTLVRLGNLSNQDRAFRTSFTVNSWTAGGWSVVSVAVVDGTGTPFAGANVQQITNNCALNNTGAVGPQDFTFEFQAGTWATSATAYLDVRLNVYNNAATGTLALSNVSVREIPSLQRPLRYGLNFTGGGFPEIYTPLYDVATKTWRMAVTSISTDGQLTAALTDVTGYNTDQPFRYDGADPTFATVTVSNDVNTGSTEILLAGGQVARSLRTQNNDQIIVVRKADGSYEFRGNVHNGETLRAGADNYKVEVDKRGDGTWTTWDRTGKLLRDARRVRCVFNTQLARSAPDSDVFANVDHTATFFNDGVMRMDRTTTLTKAVRIAQHFEWMSSHSTAVPAFGRIGNGLIVLGQVDTTALDGTFHDKATWAVWRDPDTGICFGNIFDRDSIAKRPHVAAVKTRLERASGIRKNYWNVYYTSDGGEYTPATSEVPTREFPGGTVWTATHWAFTYIPADPTNYHLEIATRSMSLDVLRDLYPAT